VIDTARAPVEQGVTVLHTFLLAREQEYFVSQTPELAAMADVVLDLEQFKNVRQEPAHPVT
jgi:hypothetical protein